METSGQTISERQNCNSQSHKTLNKDGETFQKTE